MLRKRRPKTSRDRKNHGKNSPVTLTVTTRPRGLERPRRRRRSEPFSTPKRHFLTENGRPARPLEDPSCTQRQACKLEPRAWEAQAEPCSMERAASLNCTCTLRLRQKATLIFPVVAAHLQSHASRAQNALGISHALVQQGQYCASAASQRTRWLTGLCACAVSREAATRRSAAALAMACPSTQCQPSAIGLHPGPRTWMHDSSRAPCATAR